MKDIAIDCLNMEKEIKGLVKERDELAEELKRIKSSFVELILFSSKDTKMIRVLEQELQALKDAVEAWTELDRLTN